MYISYCIQFILYTVHFIFRVSKELSIYKKEVEDGEKKLLEMENSNQDSYDIKKYVMTIEINFMKGLFLPKQLNVYQHSAHTLISIITETKKYYTVINYNC